MSGHIWRAITALIKKASKPKAEVVRPEAFDLRSCHNPSGACRIPLKCFDKEACQYGVNRVERLT